ncbi:MAG: riboflavin synthase [Thermaerobacter sp.]|nr:riboflavin synthase [Thermaerobacter sp.]
MFTGLVAEVGRITALDPTSGGARLSVAASFGNDLAIGESVAVSGCCLTVVEHRDDGFRADLSLETLRRTAFTAWGKGAPVNLERALRAQDRLGGHIVQGHVDALGQVISLGEEGDGYRLSVAVPPSLRRYVAPQGSLTVNGISLTVADYAEGTAAFAIIPHTFSNTDLWARKPGDDVHLEVDVIARYLESLHRAEEA